MRTSKEVVNILKKQNVKYIFGIPGEVEFELFEDLSKESSIEFIQVRHEQAAAFMADIQGRLTGKAGVCYSTLGPGVTNLMTGIANAYQDRSPVVALSGQMKCESQHDEAHMWLPNSMLMSPITKFSFEPYPEDNLPSILNHSFKIAEQEAPGPVHISLPEDIMKEEYKNIIKNVSIPKTYTTNYDDLLRFISSGNVLVVLGNLPIRLNQTEIVRNFLNHFNLPYFCTYQGKGLYIPNLYLGTISRHLPTINETLSKFDKILFIGYDPFEGIKLNLFEGKQLFYINSIKVPTFPEKWKYVLSYKLKDVLQYVINKSPKQSNSTKFIKSENIDNTIMARAIKSIRDNMKSEDILVSDVGLHKQYAGVFYDSYAPKTTLYSNGLSSMGFGLPSALSAKLLNPNKNVTLVTGDGGLLMNIQELATMNKYKLPINIFLINDSKFGIIEKNQRKRGYSYACDLDNPNFIKLANSFNKFDYNNISVGDFDPRDLQLKFDPKTSSFNEIKADCYEGTIFVK